MAKYLETKNIPVDLIELAPWHPRKNIKDAHIEEIGGSLADTYQMSPIRVTPRDSKYLVAFGGRRVMGAKAKGLKDIRAEIWELTDLELINDQARELFHTESLDGSPDWDNFVLYAFHQNVESRIALRKLRNAICPRCYDCPKQKINIGTEGYCPAFLSQTEFADNIIGNVSHDTIRLAISRAQLRQQIEGITELELAGYLLNILARLFKRQILNQNETLTLAQKTSHAQLGTISPSQKERGYRSGLRDSLELIAQYLEINSLPLDIRERLIYRDGFGPAEAERELKHHRVNTIEIPPPHSKYRTIIIDPPWPIQKILREVRPNQIEMDYPTMTLEQIADIPIPDLAFEEGCHIYLWTTHKHLHDALHILESWGANYECLLTWVKNVGITPFSWMYSTEHCLFARIGNLPLLQKGKRLDFQAKVREHSRKPDEFYDLVKEVSPEPRIDMFGREQRQGFEVWGNEPTKFASKVEA